MTTPVLIIHSEEMISVVYIDASFIGLGVVLIQEHRWLLISRQLQIREQTYPIYD